MKFDSSINYKPYLGGSLVLMLSAKEANDLYKKEEKDYIDFFASYGIEEDRAKNIASELFLRHLVNF